MRYFAYLACQWAIWINSQEICYKTLKTFGNRLRFLSVSAIKAATLSTTKTKWWPVETDCASSGYWGVFCLEVFQEMLFPSLLEAQSISTLITGLWDYWCDKNETASVTHRTAWREKQADKRVRNNDTKRKTKWKGMHGEEKTRKKLETAHMKQRDEDREKCYVRTLTERKGKWQM